MKTTFKFTSVLILFSIVCFSGVKAQIIYTDIVPDSVFSLTGSSYQLDLNNDGTPDFTFNFTKTHATSAQCTASVYHRSLKVTPLTGGEVANRDFSGTDYPPAIYLDTLINDSSYIWRVDSNQLMVNVHYTCVHTGKIYHWVASNTGKWSGATDRYLGLRINAAGNIYYGWVRITMGTASFTIKDYAYNTHPGELIFAGQISPQHLSVNTIAGNPFCTGDNVSVPYLAFGTYDTSNVFTAELSDSAGNFLTPTIIGSLHSDSSGIINSIIPPGSVVSDLYRIRVTSSSPIFAGLDNGADLSISDSTASNHIFTNDPTFVCPGSYVELESTLPLTSVLAYQWTLNGINLMIDAIYPTYIADTFGVFRCVITNGCGSFISDSIEITSRPLPQATIYALNSLWICPGQSVNLYADTDSANTYNWNRNGVPIFGAYHSVVSVNQSGLYSIQVIDSANCENFSQSDSVKVSNPLAVIAAMGPTSFCAGDSVLLKQVAYTDTSFTYQWYRDSTAIPGAIGQSYSAMITGLYHIEVSNPSGNCKTNSLSIDVEVGCLGIDDPNNSSNHFVISPNPVDNYITIDKKSKKIAAVQIVDQTGRIVFSDKITKNKNDIDVSNLARGIYIVKFSEDNYIESKQITIVR